MCWWNLSLELDRGVKKNLCQRDAMLRRLHDDVRERPTVSWVNNVRCRERFAYLNRLHKDNQTLVMQGWLLTIIKRSVFLFNLFGQRVSQTSGQRLTTEEGGWLVYINTHSSLARWWSSDYSSKYFQVREKWRQSREKKKHCFWIENKMRHSWCRENTSGTIYKRTQCLELKL